MTFSGDISDIEATEEETGTVAVIDIFMIICIIPVMIMP